MTGTCARTLTASLALFTWALVGIETRALANGDPASHVLPSREVFVPFDPSLCSPAGRRLDALTEATRKAGYPIKVAVIPTAEDLGTLFRLFGRPREYARVLAGELPPKLFEKRDTRRDRDRRGYRLLVLMPGRVGLHNAGARELRALRRMSVRSEATRDQLVRSAIRTVSKLSRAGGHRVRSPKPKPPCPDIDIDSSGSSGSSGSGSLGSILIYVAPVVMLAVALFLGSRGRSRRAQEP